MPLLVLAHLNDQTVRDRLLCTWPLRDRGHTVDTCCRRRQWRDSRDDRFVRAGRDPGVASTSGTDRESDDDAPAALSERGSHELRVWVRPTAAVRGSERQRLQREPAEHQLRMKPEVADALFFVAHKWTRCRSTHERTSWNTEMALTAGGAVVNKRELHLFMPSGVLADVILPSQSFTSKSGVARGYDD